MHWFLDVKLQHSANLQSLYITVYSVHFIIAKSRTKIHSTRGNEVDILYIGDQTGVKNDSITLCLVVQREPIQVQREQLPQNKVRDLHWPMFQQKCPCPVASTSLASNWHDTGSSFQIADPCSRHRQPFGMMQFAEGNVNLLTPTDLLPPICCVLPCTAQVGWDFLPPSFVSSKASQVVHCHDGAPKHTVAKSESRIIFETSRSISIMGNREMTTANLGSQEFPIASIGTAIQMRTCETLRVVFCLKCGSEFLWAPCR